MGVKIVDRLLERCIFDFPEFKIYFSVAYTYTLACLLHDVGHTPFSHTFEGYYNNSEDNLKEELVNAIKEYDTAFERDFNEYLDDAAPHEIISALVSVKIFGDFISRVHEYRNHLVRGDIALLARMIVGCRYQDENRTFQNVFIELLHSKILEADGLDYISRDAWASGYLTSRVDVNRLLNSVLIFKDSEGHYSLCYDVKMLNEIRSALHVKNF